MARDSKRQRQHVGWAQAFRDIGIRIVSKGQLLLLLAGIVLIIIVVRMPEKDVGNIAIRIFEILETRKLVGYILFFVALVAWAIHAKFQRDSIQQEIDRLAVERDDLQSQAMGKPVKNSRSG
jgi:uncharacterized membrane protein